MSAVALLPASPYTRSDTVLRSGSRLLKSLIAALAWAIRVRLPEAAAMLPLESSTMATWFVPTSGARLLDPASGPDVVAMRAVKARISRVWAA